MTPQDAKRIGSRQGVIAVGTGLLIGQLMMTLAAYSQAGFWKAFFWFTRFDYKLNVFIGAVIMLLCGYFYGGLAGKAIIIKNKNHIMVGFLCSMAVLLTTGFTVGWTGFFQEGMRNMGSPDDPFEDYILKPLYWIVTAGLLPALVVGIVFGKRVQIKGRKLRELLHTKKVL